MTNPAIERTSTNLIDPRSMVTVASRMNNADNRTDLMHDDDATTADNYSVAPTELASTFGSVAGLGSLPRDAFLKSIAFYKDERTDASAQPAWGIELSLRGGGGGSGNYQRSSGATRILFGGGGVGNGRSLSLRGVTGVGGKQRSRIYVDSVDGLLRHSRIEEGGYLKTINGKTVGPSMNAERALERMKKCLDEEGVLSISVKRGDLESDNIMVYVTVIKPRPRMTYRELGLTIWIWGFLCVKEISKTSIFKHTALKVLITLPASTISTATG